MAKKRKRVSKGRSRRYRLPLIILALVAGAGVAYFLLLRPGAPLGSGSNAEASDYFLDHRRQLKEVDRDFARDLTIGVNSWEQQGPRIPVRGQATQTATAEPRSGGGDPNEITFQVGLRNNGRKPIAVADIVVVPGSGTAPGAKLVKDDFHSAVVAPRALRQIDVPAKIVEDPMAPSPKPPEALGANRDYGLRVYVVAAYAEDVPRNWQEQDKPESSEEFRKLWGNFTLFANFTEIPPDVLLIRRR